MYIASEISTYNSPVVAECCSSYTCFLNASNFFDQASFMFHSRDNSLIPVKFPLRKPSSKTIHKIFATIEIATHTHIL